jgi:acyl-coenzyme A thioesterase PaaI-like protein
MPLKLEDDQMCYVCGSKNTLGLKLHFEHPQKGLLKSTVTFSKAHQGFKGIVHGGMMAMVLDEMMVNLAWKEGIPAVTVELNIRLKKAAKIGEKVLLEGRLGKGRGRVLHASSEAKNEKGEALASATATCILIRQKPDNS